MSILANCKPTEVFSFFEKICSIPRCSGNTDRIAEFLINFARERNLEAERDMANNVVIRKKASQGYENSPTIILQGHHDMVCEKADGVDFNFDFDGVVPVIEGDWIHAKDTSLGGDNGIAVAMILALLDDDNIPHPPLEILITADEEIGMLGAFAFDCNCLTGHKLINLDSEYEGILMCSCAGGANAYSTIPVNRGTAQLTPITIEISGLASGHSGVEINKGRANSNVLMARLLQAAAEKVKIYLATLEGGSRETAIAAKSTVTIGVESDALKTILEVAETCKITFAKEYATTEPNITINCTETPATEMSVLTAESTAKVWKVLLAMPDGVQAMSVDMPGLVQTSLNFGILKLHNENLYMANTVRSSVTSQKLWILEKIKAIITLAGGKTEISGSYPGWSYNPDSVLKDTIAKAYYDLYGKHAKIDAVHAGIECGLFADSIQNLDCVSIGPNMTDVHTPRERLSISSTERTYRLLLKVLQMSK